VWTFFPKFPDLVGLLAHFRLDLSCKRWALAHFCPLKISIYNECIFMYTDCILAHFLYLRLYTECMQPTSTSSTCISIFGPIYQYSPCIPVYTAVYDRYTARFRTFRGLFQLLFHCKYEDDSERHKDMQE